MANLVSPLWSLVFALVSFFGGAWFGAYFKKKGENYATKEDIGDLVDQVRAVTAATKEIEAKISGEVWDRQKRWELKRDLLFGMVKTIGDLSEKTTALHAFYQVHRGTGPEHGEERLGRTKAWGQVASELDTQVLLVGTTCSGEMKKTVLEFSLFCRRIVMGFRGGEDPDAFARTAAEFTGKRDEVLTAIRRELGFEEGA